MVKAFVPERIANTSYIPVLYPKWGIQHRANELYLNSVFSHFTEPFVAVVNDLHDADIILAPHYLAVMMRKDPAYVPRLVALAKDHSLPLVIIAYGDSDEAIDIPNAIILRYSLYRSRKRHNEICMPAIAPDVESEGGWQPLLKHDGAPTVGFCGWAAYKTYGDAIRAWVKHVYYDVRAFVTGDHTYRARKKGIYFRQQALQVFSRSRDVVPAFIVRTTHSLNKKLISLDPEVARREFIENISTSDVNLTTRGDGNAATRFYEILSLGRIPVVIDTDAVLPLEHIIPYHEFTITVPFTDIARAPEIVRAWYENVSPEAFIQKQTMAREYFVRYLRMDSFYRYVFSSRDVLFSLAHWPH